MSRRRSSHPLLTHIHITKIGHGWVGIAHDTQGKTILISGGVLPGSIIDARVLKSRKDHILAQCVHIHDIGSEYQIDTVQCPHYFFHPGADPHNHKIGCGGCKWQIIPYPQQLLLKYQVISDTFHLLQDIVDRIGIFPVIPSPESFWYRNKLEYSFGKFIVGKKQSDINQAPSSIWLYTHHDRNLGFHKQWLFSKIVDIDACLLATSSAIQIFVHIKKLLRASGLPVYDSKTHEGLFRHLVIRQGINTGQILINLVIKSPDQVEYAGQKFDMTDKRNQLKKVLLEDQMLATQVTTRCVTSNDGLSDTTRSPDSQTQIWRWQGCIQEQLSFANTSVKFQISPFSFFQTNTHGAEVLFGTAMKLIGNYQGTVLDLYCGTGSIWLSLLAQGIGTKLIGIEIIPDAIDDAHINAKLNHLQHECYFVTGKVEHLISQDPIIKQEKSNIWLVIVDPPRDGLHPDVIKFLCQWRQQQSFKLIYISCNPVTLCRDLWSLKEHFDITTLQPVDMFPHTHHCEMIACMR
jgi:23S rRNA (uracil1939-C5)-methyltransferase